jgi:serine/threonine protein kinase
MMVHMLSNYYSLIVILLSSVVHGATDPSKPPSKALSAVQKVSRTIIGPLVNKRTDKINDKKYAITGSLGEGVDGAVEKGQEVTGKEPWTGKHILDPHPVAIKTQFTAKAHHNEVSALRTMGDLVDHQTQQVGDLRSYKIVQKFHKGQTMEDALRNNRRSTQKVNQIVGAGTRAIQEVHDAGIFHRDAHTGNIIYKPDGTAKMVDFGKSRSLSMNPRLREAEKTGDIRRFHNSVLEDITGKSLRNPVGFR